MLKKETFNSVAMPSCKSSYLHTYHTPHILVLLPINLIEWPRVPKTALPNLIYHLARMRLILNPRPRHQTQCRASPHAMLQLLHDAPLIPCEELSGKATLAAQRTRANLQASLVPQILRVNLELQMIPRMHHFMRHGILLVPAIAEFVGAQQNPVVQAEAARLLIRTHSTQDVGAVEMAA